MRAIDLVRSAVRRGRGRRVDLGTQRRPGHVLLGRLAARRVAEPVPAGADRHLLSDRRRDPGAELARRPAAAGARVARRAPRPQRRRRRCAMRWRSTSAAATRRAQKSAQRALAIQVDTPELAQDNEFTVLGHLLAAGSAHRLQDRGAARRGAASGARAIAERSPAARSAEEGARLLAAEWALDDRDAPRALRAARRPAARRRAPHPCAAPEAAGGAPRPPAAGGAEDGAPAGQAPGLLEGAPRSACCARWRSRRSTRRTTSTSCAASGAASTRPIAATRSSPPAPRRAGGALGAADDARGWLRPFLDRIAELGAEERASVAEALVAGACPASAPSGCRGSSRPAPRLPRDGGVALAAGCALAERGLWGKARTLLEQAADDATLAVAPRRKAWIALAELATREGDAARAATCLRGRRPPGLTKPVLIQCTATAAVAQLDRVLGYEPRGRGFDSCQPHQTSRVAFGGSLRDSHPSDTATLEHVTEGVTIVEATVRVE